MAEEALAIAVFCALAAPDFESGVLTAVNHGGDSDSTGQACEASTGYSAASGDCDDTNAAAAPGLAEGWFTSRFQIIRAKARS